MLAITVTIREVPSPQFICAVKEPNPPDTAPRSTVLRPDSKVADESGMLKNTWGGTWIEVEDIDTGPVPALLVAVTAKV